MISTHISQLAFFLRTHDNNKGWDRIVAGEKIFMYGVFLIIKLNVQFKLNQNSNLLN